MPDFSDMNLGDGPLSDSSIEKLLELKRLEVEEKKKMREHELKMAELTLRGKELESRTEVELADINSKNEIAKVKTELEAKKKESDNAVATLKIEKDRSMVTVTKSKRNEASLFGLIGATDSTCTITGDTDFFANNNCKALTY